MIEKWGNFARAGYIEYKSKDLHILTNEVFPQKKTILFIKIAFKITKTYLHTYFHNFLKKKFRKKIQVKYVHKYKK